MYLWTYRSCNLEVTIFLKNRWFTDLNTQGCLQKYTILVPSFPISFLKSVHHRFREKFANFRIYISRKKVRQGFVTVNIFSSKWKTQIASLYKSFLLHRDFKNDLIYCSVEMKYEFIFFKTMKNYHAMSVVGCLFRLEKLFNLSQSFSSYRYNLFGKKVLV